MAAMAYETGISPQDLLDAPPEILAAMIDYREALVKQAKKASRG